jgi:23S rRNA (adenine2030-N6)-methyltransferase
MARKNREFDAGIQRVWRQPRPPDAVKPYLAAVRTTNPGKELTWYPGSPRIVRHFLRPQDRMALSELHPTEAKLIAREFQGDRQVKVESLDGYTALKAWAPPKERRGLVHIDPAYELKNERRRVLAAVADAHQRWATGIYAIWYPIQDRGTAETFLRHVKRLGIPRILAAELTVLPEEPFRLNGSGMFIINPPWQLDEQLKQALPWLWEVLSVQKAGGWRTWWLTGER